MNIYDKVISLVLEMMDTIPSSVKFTFMSGRTMAMIHVNSVLVTLTIPHDSEEVYMTIGEG